MEGLFRGIWYRSAVELKGDKIVPVPPFEPYNPFDWYYSANDVRQGKKSLYLEFLDVDSDQPEEVVNFCQRFGVLGDWYPHTISPYERYILNAAKFLKWIPKKAKIKISQRNIDRFYLKLGDYLNNLLTHDPEKFQITRESLGTLMRDSAKPFPTEICLPMAIKAFSQSQKNLRRVFVDMSAPQVPLSSGNDFVIAELNQHLFAARVRPYLHWDIQQGRAALGWESYTLDGIMYLMAMIDFLGPGNVLSCPRCHKFFMTASKRMKYCSPSCYENFKVQKYQKKKKEELLAAQKGKKIKTRKSTGKKK